ncbi:hypothetical protein Tco_0601214 [Tanacetum coccineum]
MDTNSSRPTSSFSLVPGNYFREWSHSRFQVRPVLAFWNCSKPSSGRYLGMWQLSVSSTICDRAFQSCIGMYLRIVTDCDDWYQICIEESTTASLVLVICHPVKVRAGCSWKSEYQTTMVFLEL